MEEHLSIIYGAGMALLIFGALYLFFRCKHAWELVDKTQLPSKLEEVCKNWRPTTMMTDDLFNAATIKATLVVRCPKCGHCKIIRMSN
jgi:hypothetical protein